MAVTAYGLSAGTYEALPDFSASRDEKGLWTAFQSFVMRRDTWEDGASLDFARNAPITSIFPQLGSYWSFLLLNNYEVSHSEGAIQTVTCEFQGFSTAQFDPDNEDVSYHLSGTRVERSILLHPLFRQDVTDRTERNVIAGAISGQYRIDTVNTTDSSYAFLDMVNLRNQAPTEITAESAIRWLRLIFEDGMKTYKAPTLQWTCETTNLDGLPSSAVDFLGVVQYGGEGQEPLPPGSPPVPISGEPWEWMLISLQQSQSTTSGITTSRTWELGPPRGFPKFKNAAGEDTTQGPYNYSLALLG